MKAVYVKLLLTDTIFKLVPKWSKPRCWLEWPLIMPISVMYMQWLISWVASMMPHMVFAVRCFFLMLKNTI
ncbi:hypothetical protein ATW94_06570 [Oenococcus oeni]|nr:hypothetical protein ATW94_06570 [Oenococcus oeni]